LNPRPLGYEPYDGCLSRLGESPVITLTSADLRREVVSGLLRLLGLSLSRRIPCTIPCTNLVPDLPVIAVRACVTAHTPACRSYPVTAGPSVRERAGS
jgi:hypothetical protein